MDQKQQQNGLKQTDALIGELFAIRDKIREHKLSLEKLNETKTEIEWQLMDILEDAGLDKFESSQGTFSFSYHESVKMPQDTKGREKLFQYLKDVGDYDRLISINSQRLNSWYKAEQDEWLQHEKEKGGEFKIPGLEEPSVYRKVYLRKTN